MRACRPWTAEDDAYLAANYATGDLNAMARHLGRTQAAIRRHAQDMGFRRPNSTTKGMKFPNRARPTVKAKRTVREHELYQVCAGWVR